MKSLAPVEVNWRTEYCLEWVAHLVLWLVYVALALVQVQVQRHGEDFSPFWISPSKTMRVLRQECGVKHVKPV